MAYSELVKNLKHIRSYMRDFYLFGFKSREDYAEKSLRSYDDERRRLESWLGEYMGFRRTAEGKQTFISIDSRSTRHNPLFNAWKAKSFTDGDITLHFILFDILLSAKVPISLSDMLDLIDAEYLSRFDDPILLDESTVRKKLKEYAEEGILTISREGKRAVYSLPQSEPLELTKEILDFYSEVAPCGVIGSFLLDKGYCGYDAFAFKHHYITGAIDSELLLSAFYTISQKRYAEITSVSGKRKRESATRVLPLQIFVSVQSGRQYLMVWYPEGKRICAYRLDYIIGIKPLEICDSFDEYLERLEADKRHMWGVVTRSSVSDTKHIDFTIHSEDNEEHILRRLMRERRCGGIEIIDKNTYRFSADVYDANELLPWIKTFICRIVDINIEDKSLEEKFKTDLRNMYGMYGIGGDADAVQ